MEMSFNAEDKEFYNGLILAIISSIFIGSSFIIKKIALIRLNRHGLLRAGAGGFGYLKEWIWWLGLITMGLGELANFGAYTLAPATLVTPLGALSILVSAVLASHFLKEKLNTLGKLGCGLCIWGSIIIVIHSPHIGFIPDVWMLLAKLQTSTSLTYAAIVAIVALLIIFHLGPKYGDHYVFIYIILCASIGSLTVVFCKGLGLALQESVVWPIFFFFTLMSVCVLLQMNYLNKALDLFNTNIVMPVYYVFFTSFVILASLIVFEEWKNLNIGDIIGNVCGFFIIVIAMVLLIFFKDYDIHITNMLKTLFHGYQNV